MSLRILCLTFLSGLLILSPPATAQDSDRKHIPISIEDVLRQQAAGTASKETQDINDRLRSMSAASHYSQDYLLGPGDVIEVTVFGIEDLRKKELSLDSEGRVSLPFINQVRLLGLTPREAEVKISTLFEASVMKNPQVSVNVKDYRSQFVNVLGAVFKPGTYQLTRRTFLVDALAMAGGLMSEKAEPKAYVNRSAMVSNSAAAGQDSVSATESLEIDLVQLLERGEISLNVPIYAGDVINIPEKVERFYYVLGDVNRGGAFEIKRGEAITLTKALASAGSLMPTAKASKTVVMRPNPDGTTQQILVDVPKLVKGKLADLEINQNDVVFVPGSTTKSIGHGILNGLSSILSSIIYVGVLH